MAKENGDLRKKFGWVESGHRLHLRKRGKLIFWTLEFSAANCFALEFWKFGMKL